MDFPDVRPLSTTAKQILRKRYFGPGETEWGQLVDRNVNHIAPNHPNKELFREIILNRYFLPNSPSLANAGKQGAGLCACFTVDFQDTIEEIYKTKFEFAQVARKGGGCGTTLSNLRPKGSPVGGSSHGYAGGPIAFADTISHDMNVVTQGSNLRAMAIMFTISVYHPDVLEFITAKKEEGKIANANISVVVDDSFMQKVEKDETFWTEFGGRKYQELKAKDVFEMIIEGGWRNGEPGFLFQNRIDDSPYKYTGQKIQATNPCSEQPLPPNGVCNLGSIDLSKLVSKAKEFEYDKFEEIIRLAVKYLDLTATVSEYPTREIAEWMKKNRPVGTSLMGWADYLLMRGIAYGSDKSLEEIENIGTFFEKTAYDESEKLGKEYGIPEECQKLPVPRRNITVTTLAPTGTVSLIAGCSSGIEPIFSEITIRNDKTGTYQFNHNLASEPFFRCAVAANGATEVTWEEHVKALAAWQNHIDSGVSKTINFPEHTHRETMGKAAIMAWKLGCKGLASYRNNSRKVEVLTPKNLKKDLCPQCGAEIEVSGNSRKCSKCEWKMKEIN